MKFDLPEYTLDRFFDRVVAKYASRPSLALVGETPMTYAELGERVRSARNRLQAMGIRRHDHVALLGKASPDWAISFLAVTTMGAVVVPILDEFPEADIDHVITHSDSVAVIIEERLFRSLFLPSLERGRLVLNPATLEPYFAAPSGTLLDPLAHLPERMKKAWERAWTVPTPSPSIREDDLAEIIYTSGTTGHSKGVMLTHRNLVSNLFEGPDLLGVIDENSVILSFLPLAHTFGSTSGFLSIIYRGASIYFLGKKPAPKLLMEAMQEVRPTIIGSVPLVFEKIFHKQVQPTLRDRRLLRLLTRSTLGRKLVYRLVGRRINKALGGRLKCAIIGGAGLNPDVEQFLREGGVPYSVGYGMTECSPLITFSAIGAAPLGSSGHAISGVTLRIEDPDPRTGIGEILVRGPNVMSGYYKNDAETRRSFTSDGFLITGDRGYVDEKGYLFIKGRSKNVIIGPSGENVYPETIEEKLNGCPEIEESLVYESGGRLVARVLPDYNYLQHIMGEAEAAAGGITRSLEEVRTSVNRQLSSGARLQKIIEQTEPFVKTATNKIKRYLYTEHDTL